MSEQAKCKMCGEPMPEGWTPEYIASALAKAYPQAIEAGDVIEFAHGNDAPMFQRLTHQAAVEDWNGKLRARVVGIYKPCWRREGNQS